MTDALEQLFAFKWRQVEIPISKTRMTIAHDLVEHKYWRVDGARVEDTGLAPIRIHATIPLQNGIIPGASERWSNVYPTLMRALVRSFSAREKGPLGHPEFGNIACQAEHLEIDWDAMKRGGCDAEASWVQTNDDDAALIGGEPSPVADMTSAASDFDSFSDAKALVPEMPVYFDTFESLMNRVAGAFDQAAILAGKPQALLNRITYRAQQVQDSAERAKSALTWPMIDAAEKMKASSDGLRRQLVEAKREIGLYRVPAETTLAGVQLQIPESSLTDLIRLNPALMRDPSVPKGSIVRFFGKRLAA